MCTEQKYGEGVSNAPTSEQPAPTNGSAANSGPQTTTTADERQGDIEEYDGYINSDLNEMLSIVADLNASTSGRHPITVVADLLEYWLDKANPNFEADQYSERMKGALSLISAWRQLGSLSESVYYNRNEIDQLQKGVRGE